MPSFETLGLSTPITDAVQKQGYHSPTPIQVQAIPAILKSRDVIAAAQTGTGKTASFALPIIEKLLKQPPAYHKQASALILTPTRELAKQVYDCVTCYSSNTSLRTDVIFGGVKINPQIKRLQDGVDILIATPGRLLDLLQQQALDISQLTLFVLDEADRMLDMGFIHDIRKVVARLPQSRQSLMFSATFSEQIRKLARTIVTKPIEIDTAPKNSTTHLVKQVLHPVDKKKKSALLAYLIKENNWQQTLVFTRTKHGANRLTGYLDAQGITAACIHGNKSQNTRMKALSAFKENTCQVLVATDIVARGIDIDQLPQVVNFDLPTQAEDYVHRIGRTGRAGYTGSAISLVCADEVDVLRDIEKLIKKKIRREYVPGFEPKHELPETTKPVAKKKASQRARTRSQAVKKPGQHRRTARQGQSRRQVAGKKR